MNRATTAAPAPQLTLLNAFTIEKLRSFRFLHQPLPPSVSPSSIPRIIRYIYIYIPGGLTLPFCLTNSTEYSSTTVVSRYLEHADGRSTSGQPRFRIVNRARRLAGGRAVNSRRHIANSQGPFNCSFARGNRVSSRILAAYPISGGEATCENSGIRS